MARCPDCNKFVGNEQQEPELNIEVSGTVEKNDGGGYGPVNITGDCRLSLACSDCGTELSEYSADIDFDVDMAHNPQLDHDVTLENEEANSTDRYGKGRRAAHFYGAEITGTLKCTCGTSTTFTHTVEEQASGFDSLN